MAVSQQQLGQCLAELMPDDGIRDYCPNGLQVEGKSSIERMVVGVSACQALLEKAISLKADAILVHHGYFWKGELPVITGMLRRRLKLLLDHDINLYGYHLPLDVQPQYGNNAQLAKILGWEIDAQLDFGGVKGLGHRGYLVEPMPLADFAASIHQKLVREPLVIEGHDRPIKTLAWCSGGAQDLIVEAAALGVDAYISGEVSERTVHQARELGIHYIAAGHHATERYGVQAIGRHISQHFDIDVHFIDIGNPV